MTRHDRRPLLPYDLNRTRAAASVFITRCGTSRSVGFPLGKEVGMSFAYTGVAMMFFSVACSLACVAQRTASTPSADADTLHSKSTLVLVPTIVTTSGGDIVHGLQVEDFALTDQGVPQVVQVEESSREQLAVIVLLQIGGSAPRQFKNYKGIATMLEPALASAPYAVSLITFDSEPEDRWPFSRDAANLHAAFASLKSGNTGAATLDAIEYSLDWFEDQHPRGQRLILLISDEHFKHSDSQSRRVVRRLAETNTAIYSLSFSAENRWVKDQFSQRRDEKGNFLFSPNLQPSSHTFDLKAPLTNALAAMRKNTAQELSMLSGGSYLPFSDRQSLENQLLRLANDLGNRYLLSFTPASSYEGLHLIDVRVLQHPDFRITARKSYWNSAVGSTP